MNRKLLTTFQGAAVTGLVLFGLIVVSPRPAAAIFGIGDIVFDPSSWASLGQIWSQDITNGLKIEQELTQMMRLYNNAVQVYNLAQQEASFIHNKQIFQAVGMVAQHAAIANAGGETSGWDQALTTAGGLATAAQAWQHAVARGTSMQARVHLADSLGIDALNVIGSCHSAAADNNGALWNLQAFAMDLGQASNTAVSQANAGTLAQVQLLRTQQCQHAIANEQLKQKLIENLRQRDIESDQLAFSQNAASYASTENNSWSGGATSFSAYRIP